MPVVTFDVSEQCEIVFCEVDWPFGLRDKFHIASNRLTVMRSWITGNCLPHEVHVKAFHDLEVIEAKYEEHIKAFWMGE